MRNSPHVTISGYQPETNNKSSNYYSIISFGEIAVFAMIFAHIDSTKTINKYAILGVLTGFAILALATLRSITVIGVCGSARYVYPALEVVGEVPASFIVQMMLTFNWYLITFVKFVICYYAFNFGLGQLLGLKIIL